MTKKLTQLEAERKLQDKFLIKGYKYYPFIYEGSKTPVTCFCHNPEHEDWTASYNSLTCVDSTGCPECGGSKTLTQKQAEFIIKTICSEKNYTYKPFVYKNVKTRLYLKCDDPTHDEWDTTYNKIVHKGTGCPRCNGSYKVKQIEAEQNVIQRCIEDNYTHKPFIYKNCYTTILVKCSNENHEEWEVKYNSFVNGRKTGCPYCANERKESINLVYIDSYFSTESYYKEYRFEDCRNVFTLPFDRYSKDHNLLIEYDGEQHFEYRTLWYKDKDDFNKARNRDEIKTNYAINNDFNFLRIAYHEDIKTTIKLFLDVLENNKDKQIIQIYGNLTLK